MTNKIIITAIVVVWIGISLINSHNPEPLPMLDTKPTFDFESLVVSHDIVIEASPLDKLQAILEEQEKYEIQLMSQKKEDPLPEPSIVASIENYRQTYFAHSPVTTEMIINVSQHYQIPVGFVLAVGHNESHMGTKGRAVETRNPMNVGNTDAGDYKAVVCGVANNCLNDWEQGLNSFATLIRDCYFHEGEEIKLDTWITRDFRAVRCGLEGKRYMTDYRAVGKYQERIQNLQTFKITY